ncbi:baculoviral IAP repeat-containing protein 1-like [Hyperolius riggenbachi]|uniref:baculoviral IAP repeat-containing protein 1-like n=1 Tax=Hyperolius riggenbachi TaxID=752182 RepID=UPI0035A33F23
MDLINIFEFSDSSCNIPLPPHMKHIDVSKSFHRAEEKHRKIREQLPRGPNYSMRSELKRLKSLMAMDPLSCWSLKEMASAGFFHTGLQNSCQCFCCGLVLCRQPFSLTPMDQHRKFNPNCEFVKGCDTGNISKYDIRVKPTNESQADHMEAMDEEQSRMKSFSHWPVYALVEPSALAQAGFFFTGIRDTVQCFSCGGCLGNWEEDDDPWKEHAKWFSYCSFLQSQKNRDEIKQYILSYCGFVGVTGAYFTSVWQKRELPLKEIPHGNAMLLEEVQMLKDQLIETYSDSAFHNTLRDSISIDLKSLFVDMSIMMKDIRNQPVRQLTLPDILSELGDITMIEGEVGSGKTALLRKIAILWASGKCPLLSRFSLVFYISLSSTTDQQPPLYDIICQQLVATTTSIPEESLGEIIKYLKDKVLFLLDDYGMKDCIPGPIQELLLKNPWNRVTITVTVCTDKSWMLRQYARTILNIQKFPLYSSVYLMKNILSLNDEKVDEFLLELVASKNLPAILQTPLIIVAQFSSWANCPGNYKFDDINIFKTYLKCIMLKFPEETEVVKCQVSSCGDLALKGLFQSKFQFSDEDLKASGVDSGTAIKLGLLSKFTAQRLQSMYRFYDPSFQEFLAGNRLSELLESDKLEDEVKGFHYLHQVNSFLKVIGCYSYFLKYASRISAKATVKIFSFLFTLYDNSEALDCHLETREHLQRHPELELIENQFLLTLRQHVPTDINFHLVNLLATLAIEAADDNQCLSDCAPIIKQFLAGKTVGFLVNIITNNDAESVLRFLQKYPECISTLSCIKGFINATNKVTPQDYANLARSLERYGVPTIEDDYSSAYLSLSKTKEDNEKSKKECDEFYSVFPEQIELRDSIIHPFKSFIGHKVPIFDLDIIEVSGNKSSKLDSEAFNFFFSISDHIVLQLSQCRDFVEHIGPAIEQFLASFKKLTNLPVMEEGTERDFPVCTFERAYHQVPIPDNQRTLVLDSPKTLSQNWEGDCERTVWDSDELMGLEEDQARFIQNFEDLENLHLSLKYFPDFDGLMKSLVTCKKLEELNLFRSYLEEDDMGLLAEALKNLTTLKVLDLDRHVICTGDVAENFATALGFLVHLEKLWLPIGPGMSVAAKLITEQFQNLSNLQFLCMKDFLDDESIAVFGEVVRRGCLQRLQDLQLDSNHMVSESGWRTFFETAGNMPELKILNVVRLPIYCIAMHATTVTAFVRFVSRLPSLMTIWMIGWLLDKDDLNMFNNMKEKHPQSKSLEVIWQMPLPFPPNIQD